MKPVLAIILKGYPRLSETFIAQELLGLQERGIEFEIVSLRRPTDKTHHPVHEQITAPLRYLPEYLYQQPLRVWRAWRNLRNTPSYKTARKRWLADLRRDPTANRCRRFGQALVLANEAGEQTKWFYVHFLHTPASVAHYAALLRDLPWSCSAHAKDIYTSPDWELAGKLSAMQWLVTCTRHNVSHLKAIALTPRDAGKVSLLYHGLDLARFTKIEPRYSDNDGSSTDQPVTVLSVGRAVEKKGYDVLLQALSELPGTLNWRLIHIGGGAILDQLRQQARDLGIIERISWRGACAQEEVLEHYRRADLFALTSLIAQDGDRDGLPNVLMEAQTQGLACLSTTVSAIPELIDHEKTGLLVAPGNVAATTAALQRLITSPELRAKLGRAGQQRMHANFSHEAGIDDLAARFDLHLSEDGGGRDKLAQSHSRSPAAEKPCGASAT